MANEIPRPTGWYQEPFIIWYKETVENDRQLKRRIVIQDPGLAAHIWDVFADAELGKSFIAWYKDDPSWNDEAYFMSMSLYRKPIKRLSQPRAIFGRMELELDPELEREQQDSVHFCGSGPADDDHVRYNRLDNGIRALEDSR